MLVTFYVDDLPIGSQCEEAIGEFVDNLSKHFKLERLGNARFVVGIEVHYNKAARTMRISKQARIFRMIEKYNYVKGKAVYNPCSAGQFLAKNENKDSRMVNRPYRSLVGSLWYIANGTRPDVAVAVSQLSRHLEHPSEEHWNAAIGVLRYLKSTTSKGICFGTKRVSYSLLHSAMRIGPVTRTTENQRLGLWVC